MKPKVYCRGKKKKKKKNKKINGLTKTKGYCRVIGAFCTIWTVNSDI